jgi:very-short-patch-repair endonuclease
MKNNDTSDKELFQKAKPEIFQRGRELRKVMTTAEKILWNELRRKKINNLRFRRQHPLAKFVVDFYCHEKRLVIELDGPIHDTKESKEKDKYRTEALEQMGLKVIRFRN